VLPEAALELDPFTELAPDLVVVHLDDVGGAKFTTPFPVSVTPAALVSRLRSSG
jgi:hypothetical protein